MRIFGFLIFFLCIFSITSAFSQKKKSDSHIVGHVVCGTEHLPYASVTVKGTAIGTTTDETGHYQILNIPAGDYLIKAQILGYISKEISVSIKEGETKVVDFELKSDVLGLDEVVVSGDRNEINRKESAVVINTINPKLLNTIQSVTIGDGLNFCPGLRTENNCQNCGFVQLRMNGMEGSYSQILINSRPVFSGLAAVYGLELFPSSMVERIEVIRGGGSVLYGSNAIAGTVNLILKNPINNSYFLGSNNEMTGIDSRYNTFAWDHSVRLSTSIVSPDNKTGMALYGFSRKRSPFDANNDDFSEISLINNSTIGTRIYHRFGSRGKLNADYFHISEERRGGNAFEKAPHESDICESAEHKINNITVNYEQFLRDADIFSVYASAQHIKRNSYYGAEKSLKDYGLTQNLSYNSGIQYNARFNSAKIIFGTEIQGESLADEKQGFADYSNAVIINDSITSVPHTSNTPVANQESRTAGIFTQLERSFSDFTILAGARVDNYEVKNLLSETASVTGTVFIPRLTLKYNLNDIIQFRSGYAQGYRVPQVFDEDLHIETSGSRKVIHVNAAGLKQESSHSGLLSADLNKRLDKISFSFMTEAFYTRLNDPFSKTFSEPDSNGTVIYTRFNSDAGATVRGINFELSVSPTAKTLIKSGFTWQESFYDIEQDFNEKNFLHTPATYGYLAADWQASMAWEVSVSGNYTGTMRVPYFGTQSTNPDGELRNTESFFNMGAKVKYNYKINGATLQIICGVRNIFDSYQRDFDYGKDRDPGYVYGPGSPRSIYFGLEFGNMIR